MMILRVCVSLCFVCYINSSGRRHSFSQSPEKKGCEKNETNTLTLFINTILDMKVR